MASLKIVLYLGVYLSFRITAMAENNVPKAENVHWTSLDFKTTLTWTNKPYKYRYSVRYTWDERDWHDCPDCTLISATECDLTACLNASDRTYMADIQTESLDNNLDTDDLPHTFSPTFNLYKESNISTVKFTVKRKDDSRVTVNITDTLTGIHQNGKQLTIRDVLKKDLEYKIIYYKSGSTGKRDMTSHLSVVDVPNLDAGLSYCFMVAAYISSRPPASQHGTWSQQQCTKEESHVHDLKIGTWVGVVFSLAAVIVIIVTVVVLCCRTQNKTIQTSQSSQPI
ncbi:tissue factor-like [Channa argus]|uniref:tissue factor-like n=1 Tax=Channa argus TaxID=215402 RepID=UPI0029456742|nr:hypothetical protein Q8A73_015300 [Channa argus]